MYRVDIAEDSGSAVNLSLGALTLLSDQLTMAVSIEDFLNSEINYDDGKEDLPLRYKIGLEYQLWRPIKTYLGLTRIVTDTNYEKDYLGSLGLEYRLNNMIAIRGSYYQRYAGLDVKDYMSIGLRLDLFHTTVSYAYRAVTYREAKNQHFLTFSLYK